MPTEANIHWLITGINTGLLIVFLLWLFMPRRRPAQQPEQRQPAEGAEGVALPFIPTALAMTQLCAAVEQESSAGWESIEIVRIAKGQASMRITLAGEKPDDPEDPTRH